MKKMFQLLGFTEMNYRFMRIIIFFDLPTLTTVNKREYVLFRRFLIKNGFLMMQESVYCKLALNMTVANAIIGNVRKNKLTSGNVQILTITENQFSKMEYVIGEKTSIIIDSNERLVIL